MAITASVRPELGRIVYAASDFPYPIRFRSSKEGPDHTEQNRAGSDPVRFWPNASGPEASRCARLIGPGSSRTQPAIPKIILSITPDNHLDLFVYTCVCVCVWVCVCVCV